MPQTRVLAIPLESIDSTTLSPVYQPINPSGLANACFFLKIINGGNTVITISYDGVTDHDVVFATSIAELPSGTVTSLREQSALFAKGLVVYAKGVAGVGSIAVVGYYRNLP